MSIIESLDQLLSILENAKSVPLTGTVIVNKEIVEEIVEKIHHNYPHEIQKGQSILLERSEILESARIEAAQIVEDTKHQQKDLINKEEIVQLANKKAQELKEKTKKECIKLLQDLHKSFRSLIKQQEEEQAKHREYVQQSYQAILHQMEQFKIDHIDQL
jgi:F0F1-type ATP synthase membrane subunit b/b'